ncbi:MAG: NUDIX domain-containing protein [Patescibacteria group bacterium]|jgi:ADP-ribose pyrophosphatase YjhB (NUDIX family)
MDKINWQEFDRGVFLINLLAVIKKDGKILIGRRENDPYLKNLTWSFPGGRPKYGDDLEKYLSAEVKKKTNLDVKIKDVIFAKTYPENRQFLSIYYTAEIVGGKVKAGEKFKELKWVKPEELKTYFTTSLHPKLYRLIQDLK